MRLLPILAAMVWLLVAPAAHAAGFLAAPTDQLTVPGEVAGAEITPEGSIYTGAAEYAFRYGARPRPWDVRTRHRVAGRYPVLTSSATAGGVRYALTTFADDAGETPAVFVHVDAVNRSERRAVARWITATQWSGGRRQGSGRWTFRFVRPSLPTVPGLYTQPGEAFDAAAVHAVGDGAVTRDGRVLYTWAGAAATRGGQGRAHAPSSLVGRVELRRRLAPGAATSFDLRIPITPRALSAAEVAALRSSSFEQHRLAVVRRWRATLGGGTVLDLPEPAVRDAWRASVVQLLEPRYRLGDRWVQTVNKLQYHSFWLRDTAIIAQALDLAGLPVPAREDLEYFADWQQEGGLFISRPGQMDGIGQALWGLGEHVRLSGDAVFAARWLPAVQRAADWLRAARAADPLGLVPASDPHDNELVVGHLPGDDFWAVAGLDAAADLADAAGRADLALQWRADRDDLRARVTAVLRDRGGPIPPALDAPGGHDWGNLWAAWPYPVLAPRDPQVTATMRRTRASFAEGIATYGTSLHGYLGFRVFQTDLAAGRQRAVVDGLYAELAHLTSTDGCFELGTRPYGRRLIADNLAPHAWCSAELVALLRNMLVRERGDGLQLLGALSPAWLGGHRLVALRDAPTRHGRVTVALRSTAGGATLRWSGPEGVPLWWTVPAGARGVRAGGQAVGGRLLRLPAASGTLRITWRLAHDRRSLARTKRALVRAYRRHGQTPPYTP
ncbi:MAG: hypothetical protein ACJ762_15055 [Solirubrobacteraceae bacterium]